MEDRRGKKEAKEKSNNYNRVGTKSKTKKTERHIDGQTDRRERWRREGARAAAPHEVNTEASYVFV